MSEDINQALGVSPEPKQPSGNVNQPDKHDSLKNIAGLIRIFAWISGGIIIITAFIIAAKTGNSYYRRDTGQSLLLFLLYTYLGVFVIISLLAQSGIIKVLIDIEKNTRNKKDQ